MQFLDRHESGPLSNEDLRTVRALEFLEHMGSPSAQALIDDLAKGEPAAELTQRALAATDRLTQRNN